MQRLHPPPAGPVTVEQVYGGPRPPVASGRPWIGLCMVASIDGSTALEGVSAGLSSEVDRDVLLTLRRAADLIIVGAGTVRAEDYGIPRKPGQRIGVVSRTGDLDAHLPLFASGAGFLILPEDAPDSPIESVRAGRGTVDIVAAMTRLPGNPLFVQAEGGPTLNGVLAAADLVDEVNLTTSPQLIGGRGERIVAAAPALTRRFDLVDLCEDDGFLFSRYVRRRQN